MEMIVHRKLYDEATIGKIYVDGDLVCRSLEDPYGTGIKGNCCIPEGKYQVKQRFEGTVFGWMKDKVPGVAKYGIPHIFNIDGVKYPKWIDDFGVRKDQFVLIHIGNTTKDTEGCLLTGTNVESFYTVSGSTLAFIKLYDLIKTPMSKGELTIEYIND